MKRTSALVVMAAMICSNCAARGPALRVDRPLARHAARPAHGPGGKRSGHAGAGRRHLAAVRRAPSNRVDGENPDNGWRTLDGRAADRRRRRHHGEAQDKDPRAGATGSVRPPGAARARPSGFEHRQGGRDRRRGRRRSVPRPADAPVCERGLAAVQQSPRLRDADQVPRNRSQALFGFSMHPVASRPMSCLCLTRPSDCHPTDGETVRRYPRANRFAHGGERACLEGDVMKRFPSILLLVVLALVVRRGRPRPGTRAQVRAGHRRDAAEAGPGRLAVVAAHARRLGLQPARPDRSQQRRRS